MILLEFSMSPMDKGESVSPYVSRSLDIISNSGVPYRLGPMGTCLEGEWDEVMGVIKQCLDKMSSDCDRITCSIKIDYRKGKSGRLVSKMASVEAKLGKETEYLIRVVLSTHVYCSNNFFTLAVQFLCFWMWF